MYAECIRDLQDARKASQTKEKKAGGIGSYIETIFSTFQPLYAA